MATRLGSIQIIRRVTLGVTLVGLTVMAILHQRLQGIPPIDALDPFGGLETLMKYVAGGEFIKRIEPGTLVLFGGAPSPSPSSCPVSSAAGSAPSVPCRERSDGSARNFSADDSRCRPRRTPCFGG